MWRGKLHRAVLQCVISMSAAVANLRQLTDGDGSPTSRYPRPTFALLLLGSLVFQPESTSLLWVYRRQYMCSAETYIRATLQVRFLVLPQAGRHVQSMCRTDDPSPLGLGVYLLTSPLNRIRRLQLPEVVHCRYRCTSNCLQEEVDHEESHPRSLLWPMTRAQCNGRGGTISSCISMEHPAASWFVSLCGGDGTETTHGTCPKTFLRARL